MGLPYERAVSRSITARTAGPSGPPPLSCACVKTTGVARFHPNGSRATASRSATGIGGQTSAVVTPVEARVVGRAVDPDPVGLIDPVAVPARWARGERARDLDPPVLFPRDGADLLGYL